MENDQAQVRSLWRGAHISVRQIGNWEYVTRNTARPAVGIVAVTGDKKVVLVEQHRPPTGGPMIELPAGLVGDIPGAEDESLLVGAQRELLEETGYVAERWTELATGYSSPGLTDESIVFFLAEDLRRQAAGGGDHSEQIAVHLVSWEGVAEWLWQRRAAVDMKLFAGLYAAECHWRGQTRTEG